MEHLLFLFRGLLQSCGLDACKSIRTTAGHPTKSEVIGFLALCMGLERGDPRIPELHKNLGYACRVDLPGTLKEEYSTFTITEDILKEAGLDSKKGSHTKEIYKHCLEGATFTVGVWNRGSENLKGIRNAIMEPVFTPYLGRKEYPFTCHPTPKIFKCKDAIEAFRLYGPGMVHRPKKTVYIEGVGENTQYVMDSVFKNRGFRKRPEYSTVEGGL